MRIYWVHMAPASKPFIAFVNGWFGRADWQLWAASDRAACSEKASIPLSLRSDYTAEYPPSTGKVAPVIHDDSSLAK